MNIGSPALSFLVFVIVPSSIPVFWCNWLGIKIRSTLSKLLSSHLVIFGLFGTIIPYLLVFGFLQHYLAKQGIQIVSWQTPIKVLLGKKQIESFDRIFIWFWYYLAFFLVSVVVSGASALFLRYCLTKSRKLNWVAKLALALELYDPIYFYLSPPGKGRLVVDVLSSAGDFIYVGNLEEIGGGDRFEAQGILLTKVTKLKTADYSEVQETKGLIEELFIPWASIRNINIRDELEKPRPKLPPPLPSPSSKKDTNRIRTKESALFGKYTNPSFTYELNSGKNESLI